MLPPSPRPIGVYRTLIIHPPPRGCLYYTGDETVDLFDDDDESFACVEIKTPVATCTLGASASLSFYTQVSAPFAMLLSKKYMSKEHMGQMLQQLLVLSMQYCVFVMPGKPGIFDTVIIRCPDIVDITCRSALISTVEPIVLWAHENNPTVPNFTSNDKKKTVSTRPKLWKVFNDYVKCNRIFVALKLFKHALQSFYSKTKSSLDGATQQRAILRSSTSHFKWE